MINVNLPTYAEANLVNNTVDNVLGSSSIPTTGSYKIGQKIENPTPTSGGYMGFVCTTSGVTNTYNGWTANTIYYTGTRIFMNGHYYYVTISGTSGTIAPSFPTTSGGTVIDNTVTWKEFGIPAVFKYYGLIQ